MSVLDVNWNPFFAFLPFIGCRFGLGSVKRWLFLEDGPETSLRHGFPYMLDVNHGYDLSKPPTGNVGVPRILNVGRWFLG